MQIVDGYLQLAQTEEISPETSAQLRAEADKAITSIRQRGVLDFHALEEIAEPVRRPHAPQPRCVGARDDAKRIVLRYLLLAQTHGITEAETAKLYAEADKAIDSLRARDVLDIRAFEDIALPIRNRLRDAAGGLVGPVQDSPSLSVPRRPSRGT